MPDWLNVVFYWLGQAWAWIVNAFKTADYWINRPLPIIGFSALSLIGMGWFIFKNTSFGRRNIKKLKQKVDEVNSGIESFKNGIINEAKNTKEFYENQLKISEAQLVEANKLIEVIAENTHNNKVKEAYAKYKETSSIVKTDFEVYLENREQKIEENKFAELNKQIELLKKQITLLLGDSHEEREETINSD